MCGRTIGWGRPATTAAAAAGISCTATAAIDLIGLPTQTTMNAMQRGAQTYIRTRYAFIHGIHTQHVPERFIYQPYYCCCAGAYIMQGSTAVQYCCSSHRHAQHSSEGRVCGGVCATLSNSSDSSSRRVVVAQEHGDRHAEVVHRLDSFHVWVGVVCTYMCSIVYSVAP